MTIDELVDLVDGLADRMTIRNFLDFDITSRLNDRQLGVLARFLAGDRPEQLGPGAVEAAPAPVRSDRVRREPAQTEWQERLKGQLPSNLEPDLEPLPAEPAQGPSGSFGDRTSDGLILTKGEFEGVTLP